MIGRPAAAFAIAVAATFAVPVGAHAGEAYRVLKCHPWHLAADELSQVGDHNSYHRINECAASFADRKFGIYNDGAAGNTAFEQFMYAAPPHTVIRHVCLQHKLRRRNHHRAEILAWPGFAVLAAGGEGPGGWSGTQCFHLSHQQVVIRLACSQPGGCAAGPNAHAYVRDVDIGLEDTSSPVITRLEGTLFSDSWVRGSPSLIIDADDSGAGVSALIASVNGAELARKSGACPGRPVPWPYTTALVPCPGDIGQLTTSPDTARSPFVDGVNHIAVTAKDFPGNRTSALRTIRVDNAAPEVAFANAQDPDDPELIRAAFSDAHSGVSGAGIYYRRVGTSSWLPLDTVIEGGEARARIDSSSLPAGDYDFRAEASDVAGNTGVTLLRRNGTPMRLTFPLRFGSRLLARLGAGGAERESVPYGTSSRVRGRLVDEAGEAVADKEVTVVEDFGDGALIRERPTTVLTDANGRFRTKIPAGPSRRVTVQFRGTQKYLPAHKPAGVFNVRSKTSFRTSREELKEGQRVVFAGRVAHRGARIPPGGKLIELQVRVQTRRWDTVREAFRTDANGRYRLGYRFGRHYVSDAQFRFRVKVQSEGDWPFEGGISAQRKVTVHPR